MNLSSRPSHVPEGYHPLAQLAARFDLTENGIRLMARRGEVRAVMIRNRIYVHEPDLAEAYKPRPYPPTLNAA